MPPVASMEPVNIQFPIVFPYLLYAMYKPIPATIPPKMEKTENPGIKKNSTKIKSIPTAIIVMIRIKLIGC